MSDARSGTSAPTVLRMILGRRLQDRRLGAGASLEDAARALHMTGFEDRETVKAVLRALYAKSAREQNVFDQCFDVFFVSQEEFEKNARAERADSA